MKNTLRKSIATVLFLVALAPARARAAASVYADDTVSSTAIATQETAEATNVSSAEAGQASKSSSGRPPVWIDKTGIHIGGPNPVDINRGKKGTDLEDIVTILGVFGMIVAVIAIFFNFLHRRNKMQHETMRAMIEKGMPIPPELLTKPNQDSPSQDRPYRARNDLRGGLILVGVGAGLLMVAGKVGWILVFIGTARLVVWLIEDRNQKV
jgi:hypothetical protein